jgi:acetoacetyl-CoA synthetase
MFTLGQRIWEPAPDAMDTTRVGQFISWLNERRGLGIRDYWGLHRWSIQHLGDFWAALWEYFDVIAHEPPRASLEKESVERARWFPGATLNYAEHALRWSGPQPAVIGRSQTRGRVELSYDELRDLVGRLRSTLVSLGVKKGDRVGAYVPNTPEAVAAYLATVSIGAIWSSCAPEFGAPSVVDRFEQVEPSVLFGVAGYRYGARDIDKTADMAQIRGRLASLQHTILLPGLGDDLPGAIAWGDATARAGHLEFRPVDFAHPLVVMYSSGTTGRPKPIVHGHGGVLVEHLKQMGLQTDLQPDDVFFWFSTTGWVMWNILVSGLLHGSTIVCFDGDLAHPDLTTLWRLAEEEHITRFGAGAGFFLACRRAGLSPGSQFDLSSLRGIGSTGSPLPVEGYEWLYEHVRGDIRVDSASGGTDIASGFVGSSPIVPVYAGEISCPCLAVDVVAEDVDGNEVVGETGELMVREPMPSMPVMFWGDHDGSRLHESYFAFRPGAWRHGDWIRFTERGSCVISGRSDATLNRGGVRLGTSEFYSVVEAFPGVLDSLVVHLEGGPEAPDALVLFVVIDPLGPGLDEPGLRDALRRTLSPRHVPDEIIPVDAIPRTLSGKKTEVPVKRIMMGETAARVVAVDSLANPAALRQFEQIAAGRTP